MLFSSQLMHLELIPENIEEIQNEASVNIIFQVKYFIYFIAKHFLYFVAIRYFWFVAKKR